MNGRKNLKKNYNIRKTKVITAFDADEIVKKNIDAYLKKIDPQGSHIKTYVTDPGIIGGFKIIVGNIVYDNSFAGKLNLIKKNML